MKGQQCTRTPSVGSKAILRRLVARNSRRPRIHPLHAPGPLDKASINHHTENVSARNAAHVIKHERR
jgi:hypothetical protein